MRKTHKRGGRDAPATGCRKGMVTGMKQKFTLMIGDLSLNVVADAEREEVDKIAGILDRKMREIYLHSKGCSRNEAALLCALEFCSERTEMQAKVNELDARNQKYAVVLNNFKEQTEELKAEIERLESENAVLRSLITGKGEEAPAEPAAAKPVPPSRFIQEVAEAQYGTPEDAPATVPPAEETPATKKSKKSRSRVGSMYDLLSFDET